MAFPLQYIKRKETILEGNGNLIIFPSVVKKVRFKQRYDQGNRAFCDHKDAKGIRMLQFVNNHFISKSKSICIVSFSNYKRMTETCLNKNFRLDWADISVKQSTTLKPFDVISRFPLSYKFSTVYDKHSFHRDSIICICQQFMKTLLRLLHCTLYTAWKTMISTRRRLTAYF